MGKAKLLSIFLLAMAPAFAARWKIQYFFDQDRDNLVIEDLAFPSAERGIAVGTIGDELGRSKPRYVTLATSDGGAHWSAQPLNEHPRSIFFLNDSVGWLVTDEALWSTSESGRSWKRIAPQIKPDKKISHIEGGLITRVWFVDANHGFAIGLQKSVYESHDAGVTWKPLLEAAQPTGNPSFTAYNTIDFDGKTGRIFGAATPQRRDQLAVPEWMEPERAVRRREVPALTLLLKTVDGGTTWKSESAPVFGRVSSIRGAGSLLLSVYQYDQSFEVPSEVYLTDTDAPKITSVYKDRIRIMDCALFRGPIAFIAGVEPPGKLNTVPIPGKIHVLTTTDWKKWDEMEVDYKADARAVILAGPDAQHLWLATDTGMILHLEP